MMPTTHLISSVSAAPRRSGCGQRVPYPPEGTHAVIGEADEPTGQDRLSDDAAIDWDALAPRGLYATTGARLFNVMVTVSVLPVALFLGVAIALANWMVFRDYRQIFFLQPRAGWRERVFKLVKFRTMRQAPDNDFASWGEGDRLRVTRFGRFLRNSHLDELPQLVNVLRGDMNIIGPRPEMLEVEAWARKHVPGFATRLAVRPGITGWAQITQGYTGNDVEAYSRKLRINDDYRMSLSLGMDLSILARTSVWMLRGRGWRWNRPNEERRGCRVVKNSSADAADQTVHEAQADPGIVGGQTGEGSVLSATADSSGAASTSRPLPDNPGDELSLTLVQEHEPWLFASQPLAGPIHLLSHRSATGAASGRNWLKPPSVSGRVPMPTA